MPNLEDLPNWPRRVGRGLLAIGYVALALAGAVGITWPPEAALAGPALVLTRIAGGALLGSGLIAAVAIIWHRWLLELDVIWIVGLGVTTYAAVLLVEVGPERWALIVLGLSTAVLTALAGRGVILTAKVSERLRAKRAATVGGDEG